jgi:hypothetical protein
MTTIEYLPFERGVQDGLRIYLLRLRTFLGTILGGLVLCVAIALLLVYLRLILIILFVLGAVTGAFTKTYLRTHSPLPQERPLPERTYYAFIILVLELSEVLSRTKAPKSDAAPFGSV